MARYLVTGGCGFIGSHLADALLAADHQVIVLDDLSTGVIGNLPSRAELRVGDVADRNCVRDAMRDIDGCFHLAAVASVELSRLDWIGTHRTNLVGAITVLDAARDARKPVPVVYASSSAVYGDALETRLSEATPSQPVSAYGADKLGCELHARVASAIHNVPTCGLRFFNVYGPRQDPGSPYSGVISIFCDRLRAGLPVTIFGDGRQTRDFVFVSDVVEALLSAMRHTSVEASVFNVCRGRATSIIDVARVVADLLGTSLEPIFQPARSGDIRRSVGEPARARLNLGFTARTNLCDGLQRTLEALGPVGSRKVPGLGEVALTERPSDTSRAADAFLQR